MADNNCGKRSVYLDYNATTPLDPQVLEEITTSLEHAWGNPSSGYESGKKAKVVIERARDSIAAMVGGASHDVVFTSGGTEANNMILRTAVEEFRRTFRPAQPDSGTRPHFVTSNLEHDAVKLVLEEMKARKVADVTFVPASKSTGRVEAADVVAAVRPTTIMVTIMTANNETGILQPISEISERVRALRRDARVETKRILLHTDSAQITGKLPLDVNDLSVDYLTIVGHKFYGPRIGAVYVNGLERGTPLYPMFYGGGQERNYRPGTENTGMIAGLGKAAELIVANISVYEAHMRKVRDYLEKCLKREFGEKIHINGDYNGSVRLPNTCNVSILGPGLEGYRVLRTVRHLQASVGAACHSGAGGRVSPILLASGVDPEVAAHAVRLSVGRDTSIEDIDLVITDIKQAVDLLSKENS